MKKFKARENILGGTNYYDDHNKKIGESRPGLFGTTNYFDTHGNKVGTSYPGLFSNTVYEFKDDNPFDDKEEW